MPATEAWGKGSGELVSPGSWDGERTGADQTELYRLVSRLGPVKECLRRARHDRL